MWHQQITIQTNKSKIWSSIIDKIEKGNVSKSRKELKATNGSSMHWESPAPGDGLKADIKQSCILLLWKGHHTILINIQMNQNLKKHTKLTKAQGMKS